MSRHRRLTLSRLVGPTEPRLARGTNARHPSLLGSSRYAAPARREKLQRRSRQKLPNQGVEYGKTPSISLRIVPFFLPRRSSLCRCCCFRAARCGCRGRLAASDLPLRAQRWPRTTRFHDPRRSRREFRVDVSVSRPRIGRAGSSIRGRATSRDQKLAAERADFSQVCHQKRTLKPRR